MNPISDDRKRLMRDLFHQFGHPFPVAQQMGYSQRTVQVYLRNMGLVGRRAGKIFRGPNACQQHRDLIRSMLDKNEHISKIASRVGTNTGRVHQFLKKEGWDRPFPVNFQGARNPHWGGGRIVDRQGYVLLHCPSHPFCNYLGYVREHRLVMEKVLGRFLTPLEVVHHKNRKPDDNQPKNLQLFRCNADHLRHELKGKVPKWTLETLAQQNKWLAQGRAILKAQILSRKERSASESR